MDALDTSTAAVAVTVKPSVDPKVALVGAAVLLTAAAGYGVYRWRKAKKANSDDTEAAE